MLIRGGERIDVSALESAVARAGYAYWGKLRATRDMPARSDISPRDISGFLRNVSVVTVVADRNDYFFSLIGDDVASAYAASLRHRHLSEVEEELSAKLLEELKAVFDEIRRAKLPVAFHSWVAGSADQRYRYREAVLMPLGVRDDAVDHIFVVDAPIAEPKGDAKS